MRCTNDSLRQATSAALAARRLHLDLLAGLAPAAWEPVGSAMRAVYSAAQVYYLSALLVAGYRAYPASPAGSTAVLHRVVDYFLVADYFLAAEY